MKWIRRSAWGLLSLLLGALVVAGVYVGLAQPKTSGTLPLPGALAELSIERDADGIPTIQAANTHDLYFGLGVVHAQDRLWQMETHKRIASGRLAEAFGPAAVEADRFLRALAVRHAAEAQWAQTQGEARAALLAYAEGVNAVLARGLGARPPEFLILGLKPEPWTPVDSLAWSIMMAWDLGGNWSTELLRLRLALRMDKARIDQLLPPYPGEAPLQTADYPALYRALKLDAELASVDSMTGRLLAAAPESGVEGVGSNNWVLSGERTTTGRPLLANDPHLKLSAPALWYFARLKAPGHDVAGATLPGLPGVVLGQNARVAWGFTNTAPDVQDLYLERINPDDPAQYQTPEGWARFETRQETIRVKGQPDVTMTVRRTRHGPVISDAGIADDLLAGRGRSGYAIAMRWTALDADTDQVGVTLRMNRAASVDEFIEAAKGWVAPMQNMVVADAAGQVAFAAPARVPLRGPDNDLLGLAPAPGWDARYDWQGWLPFELLPQQRDPAKGYLATANQRVVPADHPAFISSSWALPHRQNRIEELLDAKPKHSLDDLRVMQSDLKSLAAPRGLDWLRRAPSTHPLAAAARQQLAGFDGTMSADRAAPLIYWAWMRHLTLKVIGDDLRVVPDKHVGSRSFFDAIDGMLERDDAAWCDDQRTPAAETCLQQASAALDAALDELQALQGPDPAAWQWGRAHQARAEHRPFSKVLPLARFFELRAPVGGDTYTVNVSRVNLKADSVTGERYLDEHGPSLRALYDLGDRSRSRFMHSSGQSGLPWSAHYRDFLPRWVQVKDVPVWPQVAPVAVLTVTPAGAPPATASPVATGASAAPAGR
jgi:penicillin amidase